MKYLKSHLPLFLLSLLISPGLVIGAIAPQNVKVAREGEFTYFQVQVPLPADSDQTEQFHSMNHRFLPRIAQLVGNPLFATPCYMTASRGNEWEPIKPTDTFIGRTREKDAVKLRLIYPKKEGAWGSEEFSVNFADAQPLAPQPGISNNNTTESMLKPAQQFARAQAEWFQVKAAFIQNDAGFLDFARLQTLRAAGLPADPSMQNRFGGFNDSARDHLYDTATGARAIQETLQLDRMLQTSITSETRTVDIQEVEGVQTKSHPFVEMLQGKEPKFSAIASLVPADQYMLRFTSVAKLQELADFAQRWGHSLLASPEVGGADAGMRERLQKQICLPSTLLSRLLGPAIVKELAVTGTDCFFREGTDITIIFDTASPQLFRAAVDTYWKSALAENPGANVKSGDPSIEQIVTADRSVSAYRTFIGNLAVYSNSLPALKRVIATKNKPDDSLAAMLDFKYMRAVWPQDDKAEDGFLYLSDAFIRRLVGPETKIKEKRRIETFGAMRMVMNAAMFHGFENGPGKTPTLEEMIETKLLKESDIAVPDGKLKWDPVTAVASNTVFGTPAFLTPLCEIPIDKVTKSEQNEYTRFRDRYQQYWRRFFDPIGIRIKVDKTISLDAYILPLIDESHYQSLKRLTGEKPAKFDLAKVSTSTLVRWQVRLDPEGKEISDTRRMVGGMFGKDSAFTDWIGTWATVFVEDGKTAADAFKMIAGDVADDGEELPQRSAGVKTFFEFPIAAGVHVKNRLSLAAFLVGLQGMVNNAAPNLVRFIPQDPYQGETFVKVAPTPDGEIQRELLRESAAESAKGDTPTTVPDIGLYYGTVGDAWYITTKKHVLERLVDAQKSQSDAAREVEYNAFLTVSPGNANHSRPAVEGATERMVIAKERKSLWQAWILYRCGLAAGDDITTAAHKWYGGEIPLPSRGKISYDTSTDQPVSSAYGPARQLKRVAGTPGKNPLLELFDSISHARAWLRFTDDGLMTHLELERSGGGR